MDLETSQNNPFNTGETQELFPDWDLTFTLERIISLIILGRLKTQDLLIFPFQYTNLSSTGGKEITPHLIKQIRERVQVEREKGRGQGINNTSFSESIHHWLQLATKNQISTSGLFRPDNFCVSSFNQSRINESFAKIS